MIVLKREISLPDLPERPGKDLVLTPRSREACLSEGIDLNELVYRNLEEFVDKQLSPRIVKLRYDYFEAKRKDLMVMAMEARDKLLQARKPRSVFTRSPSSTQTIASMSTSEGSDWGMLNLEREKLARFQKGEKRWLESCLRHEIDVLKKLEADDQRLTEENSDHTRKMAEESKRIKEMNDRRRVIEEQKQRVAEAQQELEKENAKKAFAQHQLELQKLQEKEAERKKEAHLRSLKEAEERAQKELEQKRGQDLLWEEKQQALREMQENDLARLRIIEKCKGGIMKRLSDRQTAKQARVSKSIEKNREQERKRKQELLGKLLADRTRDERLAEAKQQQMEESAKKSLQLMIKRKIIQTESQKKLEDRRLEIVAHQEEIDRRLAQHEDKRNRYLDFKRELELLRERNKQLNVDRQRKKERYLRDTYAQKIVEKDSKIDVIFAERQQMWEARRKTALASQMSRDHVKRTIMEMRIKSKTDSKKLESYVDSVLKRIGSKKNFLHHSQQDYNNPYTSPPEVLFCSEDCDEDSTLREGPSGGGLYSGSLEPDSRDPHNFIPDFEDHENEFKDNEGFQSEDDLEQIICQTVLEAIIPLSQQDDPRSFMQENSEPAVPYLENEGKHEESECCGISGSEFDNFQDPAMSALVPDSSFDQNQDPAETVLTLESSFDQNIDSAEIALALESSNNQDKDSSETALALQFTKAYGEFGKESDSHEDP